VGRFFPTVLLIQCPGINTRTVPAQYRTYRINTGTRHYGGRVRTAVLIGAGIKRRSIFLNPSVGRPLPRSQQQGRPCLASGRTCHRAAAMGSLPPQRHTHFPPCLIFLCASPRAGPAAPAGPRPSPSRRRPLSPLPPPTPIPLSAKQRPGETGTPVCTVSTFARLYSAVK
jgi:hypothetical protein